MSRLKYRTNQKNELLSYLKSLKGTHVTVNDISEYLRNQDIKIGTTTIYRHLEIMVKEGIIKKYFINSTTSACFEYIGDEKLISDSVCIHYKCEKCEKLIHLNCDEFDSVVNHLWERHGFKVNTIRTVLYGICDKCKNITV